MGRGSVFLKILEEPPGNATLILTATSPFALLPTIVFPLHAIPSCAGIARGCGAGGEGALDRKPAEIKVAAQLSEGSPGLAMEMNVADVVEKRQTAYRILEKAARGQGFAQVFADTAALGKDRESSFEEMLGTFYGLLSDLLELTSGVKSPLLRNPNLARELESLAKTVDAAWVFRAIAAVDELAAGARRNLNRQLGLDAMVASLSPSEVKAVGGRK